MMRPGIGVTPSDRGGTRCGRRRPARPSCARVARPSARRCRGCDDSDTVTIRGSRRATRICIRRNPNHRRCVKRCQAFVGVGEGQLAVDGDRVVQRREQRPAVLEQPEQARPEALVVVDEVELAAPGGQQPCGPAARRSRGSGNPAVHMTRELEQVVGRLELARVRDPERVGVAVEVEARARA